MHLLTRRYARSGAAPAWFYIGATIAFAALAVGAAVFGEWAIAAGAAVMAPVAVIGGRLVRRATASLRDAGAEEDR